jgi:hypothetical protein
MSKENKSIIRVAYTGEELQAFITASMSYVEGIQILPISPFRFNVVTGEYQCDYLILYRI